MKKFILVVVIINASLLVLGGILLGLGLLLGGKTSFSFAFKDKTFILAGGLNSDNVADAISILHPDIVDVSSGVEGSHDKVGKDKILIDSFVLSVRQSLRSDYTTRTHV